MIWQPKYTCICEEGWTNTPSNPACVVNVDECSGQVPHCSVDPPVPCIDIPGSFYCGACPAGNSYSFNFFWDLQIFQNRSWSLEYCPCSLRKIFVRGIRLGGIGVTNTDTRWVSSIPALGGDFVSILSFQFIGDVSSSKSFFSAVRRSPHYETCQKR